MHCLLLLFIFLKNFIQFLAIFIYLIFSSQFNLQLSIMSLNVFYLHFIVCPRKRCSYSLNKKFVAIATKYSDENQKSCHEHRHQLPWLHSV